MSRSLSTTLLSGLVVLLLMACSSPRKAGERACRKAERHIARAVWLCPEVLHTDSATYVVKPDSARIPIGYADTVDYDSLLAACAALNAALMERTPEPMLNNAPASATARPVQPRQDAVRNATTAIRQAACDWKDFTQTFGKDARFTVTVKNSAAGPLLTVVDAGETVRVPCPPAVGHAPCPEPGVAVGYKYFTWSVIGLFVLILIGVISWVTRGKWMGT